MYTARRKVHKEKDVEPTEFEDSVAQDVILVATQRILKPPKKGPAVVRPHGRTLTVVHDAILKDVVYPAEIVGKHVRSRIDGLKLSRLSVDLEHIGRVNESLSVIEEGVVDPWVRAGSRMALQRRFFSWANHRGSGRHQAMPIRSKEQSMR